MVHLMISSWFGFEGIKNLTQTAEDDEEHVSGYAQDLYPV